MNAKLSAVQKHPEANESLTRRALLGTIADIKKLNDESKELGERRGKLNELINAERDAEAQVAAVVEADAKALTAWVDAGAVGPAPMPDPEQREAAARKLAAAKHHAAVARAASAGLNERIQAIGHELMQLSEPLPSLRLRAIAEVLRPVAQRLRDRAFEASRDEQLLLATAEAFSSIDPAVASEVRAMTQGNTVDLNAEIVAARFSGSAFIKALMVKFDRLADGDIDILTLIEDHRV